MTKIALIGCGLSGKLAALYLANQLPDASLTIIDAGDDRLPVVGESTVEVTVQFLKALGLGDHLEEEHLHKYGLTYYFKLPRDASGAGPEYIQHEAPGIIRLPSYNLNRHSFDRELGRRVDAISSPIKGRVQHVHLSGEPKIKHRVDIKTNQDAIETIEADYVIDCSGRSRFLTKQLHLQAEPAYQRCSYWFRLEGFKREILTGLNLSKIKHHCFDSYYVTHHFYGRGYWIWVIPMRSASGADLVSFGITYRPEMLGDKTMSMDKLIEVLERDHPSLARFVLSGRKVDESRYYNYMYEAKSYYDPKGRWFLLGDAGFTFDPANSAGIAYLAHQIPQITSIIRKHENGSLTPSYVGAMESHLRAQLALQDQWSNWYEIMDDPIKMAWTLVVANMGYFHLVVPNYMSGAFLNAGVAMQVAKLLKRYPPGSQPAVYPFPKLLDALARTDDPHSIIRRAPALYELTVPFSYYRPDDIPRGKLISRYFLKRASLRLKAISLLDVIGKPRYLTLAATQLVPAFADIARSALLRVAPWTYEREASSDPFKRSEFQPPYAFLYHDHANHAGRAIGSGHRENTVNSHEPTEAAAA